MSRAWRNIQFAVREPSGWSYASVVTLGHRERQFLAAIAREAPLFKLPHGAMTRIAVLLGVSRKTVGTHARALRAKFGVASRHDLVPIAKQLSKSKGRGRSSKPAFQFAVESVSHPVGRPRVRERAHPQTEALHPAAAPSRAL